ncbi:universal stress protein [Mycobacterium noviomagense]|nr:universal stress protein [Mycobacterium noviomagense]ORB11870.1 universal stress protein [Mycobacterium noviomagense]
MGAYQTLVVGTDGSDSSLRAVDHAAAFAAENRAKLIIAMAHLPHPDKGGWARPARPDRVIDPRAEYTLGGEGAYKMHGSAPVYAILREAHNRAKIAGAQDIEERAVVGAPAPALVKLAKEVNADLLVIGDVGLNVAGGQLLGSVPANVCRKAKTDVLIVHTAD